MSAPYQTSKSFVFSLDMRQVSGVIAGAMAVLIITFALGVGFGHRLAMGAIAPTRTVDLKKLDEKPPAPPVYTYAKELATNDAHLPAAPAPKPLMAEAPHPATPVVPAVAIAKATPVPAVATPAPAPAKVQPAPAPAPEPDAPRPSITATEPAVDPDAPKKDTQDRWTVQFGAPSRQKDADTLVKQLRGMGYDPFVAEADVEGKGHFYRVRIGRFPSRQDADKFRVSARKSHEVEGIVMSAPAE